jgi:membrane-bound metal-dependent hydrolase YbcI (DUF457 family)
VPITPLHYPIAKIIHMLGSKVSLSLPALFVGSMVPDLEVPFMYFLSGAWVQDRLVLHSFIGGLTLGTLIAIILTVFLYPRVVSAFFPIDKNRVKQQCRLSLTLVLCCAIGVFSHVLLDVTNHTYNPLFWPFVPLFETPSPIVAFLGGRDTASIVVHGSMLVLGAVLLYKERGDFWNKALLG